MSDGLEFNEKVLTKDGFIPSDGPTNHPDPCMHLKLADMAASYNPPWVFNPIPPELVYGQGKNLQKEEQ